ncbi:hypothetical protein ATKI12_6599 [Kitasatospora sp. Ki12]
MLAHERHPEQSRPGEVESDSLDVAMLKRGGPQMPVLLRV